MKKITIASFLLAFLAAVPAVNAQSVFPNQGAQRWAVGLNVGPNFLFGDNDAETPMTFGFGLHAKYSISHTFGIRFVGELNTYEGERTFDDDIEGANSIHTGNWNEFSLQPVFTWGNISHLKTRKTQLYGFTGIGVAMGNYEIAYSELIQNPPRPADETGVDTMHMFMPLGLGLKYNLSPKIDLGLDYAFKFYFTDAMEGSIPQELSNKNSDYAMSLRITASYKFGAKKGGDNTEAHRDWINPIEGVYTRLDDLENVIDDLKTDSDGDGTIDIHDKEEDTPEGAITDGSGRELDMDGDGISDSKDAEPNTPFGAEVDETGKGIDSDNDGVYDGIDIENNTESDMLVNHEGIGIMKKDLAGKLGASAGILPTIFFASDSDAVKYTDYPALMQVAEYMKKNSGLKLEIIGHADHTGSESYNEKLGMKRAEAVKALLVEFGAPESSLSVSTKGEKDPIVDKKTSAANEANRRVQFMITQ